MLKTGKYADGVACSKHYSSSLSSSFPLYLLSVYTLLFRRQHSYLQSMATGFGMSCLVSHLQASYNLGTVYGFRDLAPSCAQTEPVHETPGS